MRKPILTLISTALLAPLAFNVNSQNPVPTQDPKKGTYGYMDVSGKWVVKPKFQVAGEYRTLPSGVDAAFVKDNEKEGYLDPQGKPLGAGIVFAAIDSISPAAAIVKVKDKYGVVDWNMNYILKPEYTDIRHINGKHFKVTAKDKAGMMSDKGSIILPLEYSDIALEDNDWYKVKKNGKVGYFDVASEQIVVAPEYDDLRKMIKLNNTAYFPVSNTPGLWGLAKGNGTKLLDFKYQDIQPGDGRNFIIVALNGTGNQLYFPDKNALLKYIPMRKQEVDGFTLVKGKVENPTPTSPVEYEIYTSMFPDGYYSAVFTPDGKIVSKYVNPNVTKLGTANRYIVETAEDVFDLYDNNHALLASGIKGKPDKDLQPGWTVFEEYAIDQNGTLFPSHAEEEYVIVQTEDKKWHYLKEGKIADEGFDEVSMGFRNLHNVKNNGKYGIMYRGNLILPCVADGKLAMLPNVELITATIDGKPVLIDCQGKMIAEPGTYDEIDGTGYNVLTVKKDGKTGIISADGTVLVPHEYDNVTIRQRFYIVKNDSKYGVFSFDNEEILAPQFDGIYSSQDNEGNATDEYYWTKKGDKWGILTPDGHQILPAIYPDQNLIVESNVVKATDPATRKVSYYQLDGTKLSGKREVKLTKYTIDHNIYDKNGAKCFRVNFDFDTSFLNQDKEQVYVQAKVYTIGGQPAKKANGQPIEWGYWVEPSYLFTTFTNQWITMPYAQFSQGKGTKEYFVKLTFQDESGRTLPLTGNNRINFTLTR